MSDSARGPRFGVSIPQVLTDRVGPRSLGRFLARAEELGFESLWVLDQVAGRAPVLEAVSLLSAAAALTTRARLGAAVILAGLRNPLVLARALTTVDHLSEGRLIAGFGLGDQPALYEAAGFRSEDGPARYLECVELMGLLWSGQVIDFEGRFYRARNVSVLPRPVQRPAPPIWFGAKSDHALRRVAATGDGWIGAGAVSTADFARQRALLVAHLEAAAERDGAPFAIAKRVYLCVDPDRQRAWRLLHDFFSSFYGDASLADRVAVGGEVGDCVDGLRAVVEAGADLLIINFVAEHERQLEVLAEAVVPALAKPA